MKVLINDGERNLTLEGEAGVSQFPAEAFLIDGFQQAWAKLSMHLDGKANDLIGEVFHIPGIGQAD